MTIAIPHHPGELPARRVLTASPLLWIFGLVMLALLPRLPNTLQDPDVFWHLASGQLILHQWAVPTLDPFSATKAGAPWMLHEWLGQLVMALAYRLGGWPGLALLAPLATAATLALLARALTRQLTWRQALILCLLALVLMLPHTLARPHVLAWPLTVLWTAELVAAAEQRRAPPWWLLAVMVVWANLHGSFLLGLGLAGFVAGEVALAQWQRERRLGLPKAWAGFLALALLAALATPQGPGKIIYIVEVMGQSVQLATITEWQSPNFQGFQPLELWLLAFLAISLGLGLRLPASRILILLALLHLALRHARYVELVGMLTPLFLAQPLANALPRNGDGALDERLASLFRHMLRPAATLLLVGLTVLAAVSTLWREMAPGDDISPQAALAAAQGAGARGPVFNDYNFGGYLISRGVPTFIDGRSDFYGDAFLTDYLAAQNATKAGALPALLDRYAVTWSILSPARPAVALMDHLRGWRRVYADDTAVVHVKDLAPPG